MNEDNMIDKVYNTERNVAILSKDVEQMKEDIKEIKQSLKTLIDEPRDTMDFLKKQIITIAIGGIFLLCGLGLSIYSMSQVNETKQIMKAYEK